MQKPEARQLSDINIRQSERNNQKAGATRQKKNQEVFKSEENNR